MTEVRFYHMTRTSLDQALPQMLEKTLERGQRAVVRASSEARVEALSARLWTYNDRSFLPHGSVKDGRAERQPVWLTAEDEAPNDAAVLFLTDGADSEKIADYALCVLLFDGGDEAALAQARAQWKTLKEGGHAVTYWQQDDDGRWGQKA
jgi:DNA polymerase III subunit chi